MLRLALGVVLSSFPSAWGQTVTDVPVEQGNGGTQGNPGGVSGRSSAQPGPNPTLKNPALRSALPGGSSSPKVQAKTSAGGVVENPTVRGVSVGAPTNPAMEFAAPMVEQRETPPGVDVNKNFEQPGASKGKPNASAVLGSAVQEVQAGRMQEAAGTGGFAVNETLRQVFDTARKAAGGSGLPGSRVLVSGKFQDVEEKISQTVRVANVASPHDAPNLYQAAISAAREAFVPAFAKDVARAVLASADKKAETSLPQLANEAYSSAYAGEASAVAKAFKSFGLWDKLLGRSGQPLVENMSHLRSDVERVLAEKTSGKALETASSVLGQAESKVWFSRSAAASSFVAMLPSSSVSPLPKELAASFALRETEDRSVGEDNLIILFRRNPTASNGARLIFQANREAGASAFGSFMEAAVYWFKATMARIWRAVFGAGAASSAASARMDGDYAAAMALVYARGSSWDLASARALIARGKAMAAQYRLTSGDDSAEAALASLENRLNADAAKLGVEEHDPLPSALAQFVVGDGATASHWIERLRALAPAAETEALVDPADKSLAVGRGPASVAIEKLLLDVKRRGKEASKVAAEIQSLDPSPLRYATIGRVGDYLIQSAGRRTKSGKLMNFTVMRETVSGQLAFARADWTGVPSRPVSLREIAAP